ncbi:MAG: DUF1801 domain-containing protein [Rubellimicrobium sp.]|nr:DUF1801 domain-containing protein [Rubellimicrobium sp.]
MAGDNKGGWQPKAPLPPLAPGEVRLLTGGNPQISKGDGPGPVVAYIAAMPGWKRAVGQRIDALVTETCPDARRAVRWNTPFWGMPGRGWFLTVNCATHYVKVGFLVGSRLVPLPPVDSKHRTVRYLHLHENEVIDEARFRDWLVQAARIDGDRMF